MNDQLTGAVNHIILQVIAKAIIRAERRENVIMNNNEIKSYIYDVLGKYHIVSNNESDRFVNGVIYSYEYTKNIEELEIEKIKISRSGYHFYKNNDSFFNNDESINIILDKELIDELEYYQSA